MATQTEQETYSVEQILYENVENREPITEERLVWLIDRLERIERWADRMPSSTYSENSHLWKLWALRRPKD